MPNSNILNVKNLIYSDCSYCKSKEIPSAEQLIIPFEIYATWMYLMQVYFKKEWSCTFKTEGNTIVSWTIPKQEVTSVAVEFESTNDDNGVTHSHHSMGAFHSGQDDKQTRNLFQYSVVIAWNGYEACKKVRLPCGGYSYQEIEIVLSGIPEMGDLDELIKDKASTPVTVYPSGVNTKVYENSETFKDGRWGADWLKWSKKDREDLKAELKEEADYTPYEHNYWEEVCEVCMSQQQDEDCRLCIYEVPFDLRCGILD